ncbi:MAG: hypothetical protein AB1403_16415 [Candidatus Riflebacteria bacterium]
MKGKKMEAADFAVKIEEIMAEECSAYECIYEDEEEIGRIWKFQIEDSIDGYLALEENEETIGIQTVAMGLYLLDITDYEREDLFGLLQMNADFINSSLSVVRIPAKSEALDEEVVNLDEEDPDEDEEDSESFILTIQTRIPADAFEPNEFKTYVENMLFQYQVASEGREFDENGDAADLDEDLEDDEE